MPSLSISVVIPVCNEAGNIDDLLFELNRTGLNIREMIFVDDGSQDDTLSLICGQAEKDKRIKAISFSRNFGHQAALLAGMRVAKSDLTVIMDGDLQHPPSVIPIMLAKLQEGYDIVSAKRVNSENEVALKRWSSSFYYRLINFIADTNIEENVADFRIFNRKVLSSILEFREREVFVRGLFSWIGFRNTTVPFTAPPRKNGKSKYSWSSMISLGLKGAVSFSFKPLRISLLIGLVVSLVAFGFGIFSIISYYENKTVPGWTSMITAVMFMGGIQLLVLGLMGEYISSLFTEVKQRPLFIIDRKVNLDDE
jgi:dolichol-phosphate mannosyltransferase